MPELHLTPDDHRRAAALIVHHARFDLDGINAVLDDAGGRETELLYSILTLYSQIIPEIKTPLGQSFLSDYVLAVAGLAHEDGTE